MARQGLNKVQIIGNLGRDPDARHMPNGDAVTKIAVATSESWKDRATGEQQEKTEWHNIVMFRQLGEIAAKYLKKGAKVYIEGQLKTRKWEKDGQTHYSTEIVAHEMQMLDSRQSGPTPGSQAQQGQQAQQGNEQRRPPQHQPPKNKAPQTPQGGQAGFDDFDDDIPF